jgi:DNA-binding SARP family transcriptional activator/TolB-like protein
MAMAGLGGERRTASVRLEVLGGFSLQGPDGRVLVVPNRKACAILAYLGLSPSGSETRERLAGMLWSDRPEDQARASLRQCLKQLRDAFETAGFGGFSTQRHLVELDLGQLSLDIAEVAAGLAAGRVREALLGLDAPADRILYGYESLDPSFGAWLYVLRQTWRDRLIDLLQPLLQSESVNADVARRGAEALLRIDPTHEGAHRHLIRRHALEGNTAAALEQYKVLWDLLAEDYDMEPAAETQQLIARIKTGTLDRPAETPAAVPAKPGLPASPAWLAAPAAALKLPMIGITPFVRGGPWRQETYLIDGFRRELIAALVRFREWVVVEAPAGASARRTAEGADGSGLDYLLEGAYLEDAADMRLVITLQDARSHRYIWSEQIVLTLETWFASQQSIVQRLSLALNVYLSAERLSRMAQRPDVPLDLYDRWLRGQEMTLSWRPQPHHEATGIFRAIIREAPSFGRAYSSLVQIENARPLVHPGIHRSRERIEETLRLAREAVFVDPLDSRAQLCLGWAYAIAGQHDGAELNLELAVRLNENDPWTLVSAALGFAFCNSMEMASHLAEQARARGLSPSQSHWGYQATISFLAGDYPTCIQAVERAGDALSNLSAWKGAALAHLGRGAEARRAVGHFLDLARQNWLGEAEPDDLAVARWLLQCFPIRSKAAWMRLRDGLAGAGVPVPDEPEGTLRLER